MVDEGAGRALYAVGSGFIERLSRGDIRRDFLVGKLSEANVGDLRKGFALARAREGNACDDLVRFADSSRSMRRASRSSTGLPKMRPLSTTMVSAPMTVSQSDCPEATASALARALCMATSVGAMSFGAISSASLTMTRNARPVRASSSLRRGDPDASMSPVSSFMSCSVARFTHTRDA